jgi:hypothetical protein
VLFGGHLDPFLGVVARPGQGFPFFDLAGELGLLLQDRGQEVGLVPRARRGQLFLDLRQALLVAAKVKAASRNR